jgi:hypothetical protein
MLRHPLQFLRKTLAPAQPLRRLPALDEVLPWVLPKVRPRFAHEALSLEAWEPAPAFRPMAGALAVSLVLDLPYAELDLTAAMLQAWGADFDVLLQRARQNLLRRGGEEGFLAEGRGRFRSDWTDSLDGSRLLLPGVLRRLPLLGEPVAVLPSRDTLLVTGDQDPEGLQWLLTAALHLMGGDAGPKNASPLRLRHLRWEPFGSRDPRLRPLLERLRGRRLEDEYRRQKALLDRRHHFQGRTVTLAPFALEPAQGGRTASYTAWSPAMGEAWLPEADQVRLAWVRDREPGRALVPFARMLERLPDLLEPVGLFPERYRFRQQPGPRQLEALVA